MTGIIGMRILAKALTQARIRATIAIESDEGVERPAPGAAPTAFRIWSAGENPTSKGMTIFSRRSAAMLLEEQGERGNLYSIDVDHMSLSDAAPPENHRAVGWHRLAVRDTPKGPELWAIDVEWTPEIRAALESQPPGFRYFSPAYDVARESGEVVGYLNTALTNNPATFNVTALATRAGEEEKPMKMEDILAALKAAAEGEDEKAAKKAKAAYAALTASEDEEKPKEEEKKDSDGDEGEKKEEPPKKDTDGDGDNDGDEKKDAKKCGAAAVDAKSVRDLVKAEMQAERDEIERDRLLTSRKDLSEKLVRYLASQPLATVREVLGGIPVSTKRNPAADATVRGTVGSTEATESKPEEKQQMDERMGLARRKASIRWDGHTRTFDALTAEDARAIIAARKKGAA